MALYKGLVVSNGERQVLNILEQYNGIICLLYTSPSPRDRG